MARRYYSSTAARTTLASGVDDTTNTFTVNAVSGWPTSTPYTLIIDQDTVNEEIVEVTGRTGTTITVTRGVDGTSAVAHSSGAAVNHGVSARDFDEPNAFLNSGTWQLIDAKGDLVVGTASDTADRLAVGSNGYVLRADSTEATGLEWYDIATDLGLKFDKRPDQNLQTGSSYTFATSDDAKLITASAAASAVYTVPPQSSASWADDTVLRVINLGAGEVSFAGGSGVTVNNSAAKIAQYEGATVVRTGSDSWTVVPFGGGDLPAAEVSSPAATGQYTDTGVTYDYYTFTSSGNLTVGTEGVADVLIIGGGGSGGHDRAGGGGAGGYVYLENAFLSATTHTVVVGAGGASVTVNAGNDGNNSLIGQHLANGGGGGGGLGAVTGRNGGSGGGGRGGGTNAGGSGTGALGNNGGTGDANRGGGGGGANAAGASGTASGNGGDGKANSITGSSVTRGGGGGGAWPGGTNGLGGAGGGGDGSGDAGDANTGGGGGGGGAGGAASGAGGSGVVIVRVRV